MKHRNVIGTFAAILISISAYAVPAKPGVIQYTQPDGSTIKLELHGDEFFSWHTLAGSAQVMEKSTDGFWRPSMLDPVLRKAAMERRQAANASRRQISPRTHNNNAWTHGVRHIPVILAEYPDQPFSLDNPSDRFHALLNQPGYSDNGATGSVQDYFMDNSEGQFQPVFDIYGPVTLPHEMAYYGEPVRDANGKIVKNDKQAELALYDACKLLDDVVDFSQYDFDNNGVVDMTLLYFAGYSQAEGGPENAIWPHQWSLQYSSSSEARSARFDGKKIANYFCTAELRGNEGANMCGIGVTSHEFSHSLGLPDFYDTDYEENGRCQATGAFSIMDSGCYLNSSMTPPYFNSEERIILGWMTEDDITIIPDGTVSIPSIKNGIAYRSLTDTDGEYFVYECRDGSGWDRFLPQGMLVFHADKSTVRKVGSMTPYELWYGGSNKINAYGDHPCFYTVPAADPFNLFYKGDHQQWVFPGSNNITSYEPVDWKGYQSGVYLTDIGFADGKVSFTAKNEYSRFITGTVTNQFGSALPGVRITVTAVEEGSAVPRRLRANTAKRQAEGLSAITDQYGKFRINLDDFEPSSCHVTASLEGYEVAGQDVSLGKRGSRADFSLTLTAHSEYKYYDESATKYLIGDGESNTMMASIRIPASELPAQGGRVVSVSFTPIWQAAAYYIVIDAGDQRILTRKTRDITRTDLYQEFTVDLTSLSLRFPAGKDLYVGIGIEEAMITSANYDGYLFLSSAGQPNVYMSELNLEYSSWKEEEFDEDLALIIKASVVAGSGDADVSSLLQMGFSCIADPGKGVYADGDTFQLMTELPEGLTCTSTTWLFDGKDVTGAKSVQLKSGQHIVSAVVTYADGSSETLDLALDVK